MGICWQVFLVIGCISVAKSNALPKTPEELEDFLYDEYEKKASKIFYDQALADWNYATDITNKNSDLVTEQTLITAKFEKEVYNEWFKDAKLDEFKNESVKRQLKFLKIVGDAALDETELTKYTKVMNNMTETYSTAKICPFKKQKCDIDKEGLSLEPGIESIMSKSNDVDELLYFWTKWRNATGTQLVSPFKVYVNYSKKIGERNGFNDKGAMWRGSYDYESDEEFLNSMDKLWKEVEPLYNKLHGYVRQKLVKKYGKEVMGDDDLIPAHLLGNMWGQSWINLADLTRPYPSASKIDVTKALQEQKYTVEKMFEKSNEFYMSLGLPTNEMSYGKDAMIEKPKDKEVLCHASAWDFSDKKTFRIKMCTEVNYEDFVTIHHEMGHIQYYIQYKDQPTSFRSGANPGFHEAVGDTIALSVSTPKHLKAIHLLDENYVESKEATINAQMDMALERLAFLPFGLIVDKWRWEVFSGSVKPNEWNKRWWELRSKYQKLKSPTERQESDLDPAAKYHVIADSQYINYFIAHILEFQLYRGLCITAGEYDPKNKESKPLHNCDFYNNKEVGKKLKAGLSLGLSQNWKEALKAMTGEEDLSSKAILEYFEPLIKYLDQNKEHTTEELVDYIKGDYEKKASEMCTAQNNADWNYNTDITEKNNELATQQTLAYAKFEKEQYNEWFKNANADEVTDPAIKRQLKYLKVVGKAALDENKLEQYTKTVNEMSGVYSTAKICPFDNQKCDIKTQGLSLEPGIESIMSTSKNEKELLYAWSAWRDATGMKLHKQFQTYVDLSNEIGKANNFKDKGEMWRNSYDYKSDKDFVDSMDKLWTEVEPLYNKLHGYVREILLKKYGKEVMGDDDLIPAHLLGNMWGQSWINLADLTRPYPSASKIDVTKALQEQEYTVKKMFEKSNEFYMSLGLPTNEMSYGKDAMIVKPQDREVLCHASAWDFCDKKTYRIKMCTEVNYEDFITIHHEMGHIQYFIQYKNQSISFRDGANPGFHEAVGDTIALSVSTPKHLKAIDLLDKNYKESEEATINAQMDMALERLAFLPFGLIVDKWRWEVFSGDVKPDKWNKRWWELRSKYQKLKPPTDRPEINLDPASKYHVVGDSQYINYFVAHILEFQLYRGLCITAGEYDPNNKESKPLHNCDFYKNEEVGKKLKAGLSLGLSQNWKEALKAMTGEEDLSSKAILEYFEPLIKYLDQNKEHTTEELVDYIKGDYEKKASEMCTAQNNADWNYNTDITEKNNELATQQTLAYAKFEKEQYNEWFKNANADEVKDPAIKRQLKYLKVVGKAALEENKLEQYTKTVNEMSGVYSTAKICPFDNQKCDIKTQGLSLEPGIESIMSTSKNEKELLYAWNAWRDATGMKLHKQFQTYVDLSNEIGKANNFKDKGEMWRNSYDYKSDKDFVDSMDKLWTEVEPLYNKLHGYVREKLLKKYGKEVMGDDDLIPAHLLGNMWGQSWINLADLTRPYPSASKIDVTKALQEKEYTVEKMFEKSNEFYMSLGLPTNEMSYGKDAMIVKPQDREVLCHASAWDFCDKKTYRIKMCTEVNYEDFITIHHEMGHIQYFIQYKNQSISFRDGANPGFHEAVGDTIALSVSTPKHLKAIDLLDKNYKESEEATINAQMDMALERLAFLPFGLIVDKWRWEVFSGDVKPDKWNKRWWELRSKYQKLKPPTDRPEINLDPASKYHVVGDSQYINYFVAHILEFQLYRGLCITAGEYDPNNKKSKPLHNCDFYKNEEVGKKLKAGLSLGLSQNWKEALKAMTGEEDLSSKAILEYFEPLIKYLDQNKEHTTEELVDYIKGDYEKKASEMCTAQNNADWNYNTDITEKNNELATQQTLAYAKFEKEQYNEWFKNANADEVKDPAIKRQLKYLKVVGKAALEENKLEQYTKTVNEMSGVYSTAKICPFDNQKCDIKTQGLSLEPGIESIMSTSKNEKELLYAWSAWRDATGMNLRKQFQTYVDLSNEIGKANNFKDKGEMWRSSYDYKSDKDFVDSMDKLWTKVEPLYNKLHRYVRQKLMDKHGKNVMGDDDLIPAHLLGNMWGQSWINLADLTRPYPSASKIDVTKALQEKEYTVEKMFEKSNEFYMSLGLPTNEMSYGKDAMIKKPEDREVLCHASAWDFCNKETYRIKMCTEVNYEDFITIHHEMGHIQYFIQYKNQPISFRDGANPGFHEAVGDTIALSVSTPKHLKAIELLDENYKESEEATINAQMDMALERLAFLPFGLIVDKWRWEVFSGDVKPDKWNNRWWELRSKYQKLKPPTDRSEKYLDPAAKYHVVGDSQYINYFVAHILEFQLYRGLCITAGEYDPNNKKSKPLHNCDFYKNQEVGKKLKAGLSLGLSQNWKEALKAMTGEEDLSADAILQYFEPLDNYLTKILKNGSSPIGSTFSVCLLSLLLVLFR